MQWYLPDSAELADGKLVIATRRENVGGTGGNNVFGTIHYGGEFPAKQSSSNQYLVPTDATTEFHTYALEWDTTVPEICWYVDDTLYSTQSSWSTTGAPYPAPFDERFYGLFNVAVGGNFPGTPNSATVVTVTMEVDYVRVYSGQP